MKKKYKKPQIKMKKVKVAFFQSSRFLDSLNILSVPEVFAQSGCCYDPNCSVACASTNSFYTI